MAGVTGRRLTLYGDTIGSYTFEVYLHEIGHTLGLGHPGPYGYPDYPSNQIFQNDTNQTTVLWGQSKITTNPALGPDSDDFTLTPDIPNFRYPPPVPKEYI